MDARSSAATADLSRPAGRAWAGIGAAAIALVAPACAAPAAPAAPAIPVSGVADLERIALALPGASGLSGLSHDASGHLLAIAERARVLIDMDPRGREIRSRPIVGVPALLDTESIAWLGDGRIAIGTESRGSGAASERILIATLGDDRVVVDEQLALPYDLWQVRSVDNGGLEGLCAADGLLLAAVEAPIVEGSGRFAALGRLDLARREWTAFRLRLSSATGKISALECRPRPDGDLDVLAIERHYEVIRVLGFRVSPRGAGHTLDPVVLADLRDLIRAGENFEGLEWLGRDELALISDNDHGGPRGPSLLVRVRLAPASAAR
jgi:hypothetical protein